MSDVLLPARPEQGFLAVVVIPVRGTYCVTDPRSNIGIANKCMFLEAVDLLLEHGPLQPDFPTLNDQKAAQDDNRGRGQAATNGRFGGLVVRLACGPGGNPLASIPVGSWNQPSIPNEAVHLGCDCKEGHEPSL